MSAVGSRTDKGLYQFGPFRVDPDKQTLLRDGQPIALTPKTFQLLLVLLRHVNEVVTKDELMKAVWPDTFVEETNLTRNIFTLRRALGETELDHYIVTVPGQGYRLAAAASIVAEPELSIAVTEHAKVQVQIKDTRVWTWIAMISMLLLVLGAAVAWRVSSHRVPVLGEKDTLILADFKNSTGDHDFDDTLRQGMAVELEQSPFLSLISADRIRRTLSLMGAPEDARLTSDLARQVCERLGSTAVIDGSITRMGTQFVLGLHAVNCGTGETVDDEQVQISRKEDILRGLTQIAGKFRSHAGESLSTIQQHATPLAEATTPSLEALRVYSAAWEVAFSSPQNAIVLLQRAVQIDPSFAMAYAFQGRLYADILEPVLSQQSLSRAYELRSHTSDRERFFIEQNYESQVTGNLERTQEICQLWAHTYPRDWAPHGELTWIDQELGRYKDSTEEAEKAIELDPDFTPGYNNLAWAYVLSGHLGKAEDTLQRAAARKLEMPEMLVMRYYIGFLKGDQARMDRAVAVGRGHPEAEDWIVYGQASVLAYSGQMNMARSLTRRAVELARQTNQPERAAMYQAGMAVRDAFYGETLEAKREAGAARSLSNGRDVEWAAALAYALSGDFLASQKLTADLEKRFPNDTCVQLSYLPALRAVAALHDDDPAKMLDVLQTAAPIEFGVPGSWSGFFGNLYPAYLRGMAYLAQRHGSEAAAEFQKVLVHPGIVFTDPVGALAHLQLGRAFVLAGDKAKAKTAYEDFFKLWNRADSGLPIYMRAKLEYAKLH